MSERWNDEFNNELKHAPGAIFSIGRYVILPLVLLSLVVGAVGAVNGWFSEANTVARETVGPAAAVRKYEWFKDENNSIKSHDVQITTAQKTVKDFKDGLGPRKEWESEDKHEYARLQTVLQGLKNHRNEVASRYNSASEKATWNLFQVDDLPHHIALRRRRKSQPPSTASLP